MKKKYVIRLSEEERQNLTGLVRKGKVAAYRRTHAQILLLTDEGEHGSGFQDKVAAERVGVNHRTVSRMRERCVERGLDAALEREPRQRERSRAVDGDAEAHVIALMCGEPPAGQSRWTLNLLLVVSKLSYLRHSGGYLVGTAHSREKQPIAAMSRPYIKFGSKQF